MKQNRYSIRDLLVLSAVMAVLFAVGVPAFLKARAASRRAQCSNNFKVVMLAMHNYHAAYKRLPPAMGGTASNANRLSGLVALTPFCEGQALWEEIINPQGRAGAIYPSMGPVPWNKTYSPWQTRFEYFLCPADSDWTHTPTSPFGRTNVLFCIGDSVQNLHKAKTAADVRGVFSPRFNTRFRDILDGLSFTIAIGEVATKRGDQIAGQFAINMPNTILSSPQLCLNTIDPGDAEKYAANVKLSDYGRGGNWADGAAGYALVQTILPPNSPSCAVGGTWEVDGIYSATSRHPGGVHVGMGDGAIKFIADSIECGDSASAPPPLGVTRFESPYGLWGAIGTRASMEKIFREEF